MSVGQVQQLLDAKGGARERRAPVAFLINHTDDHADEWKIVTAYDAQSAVLAEVGWRPHDRRNDDTGGLFICG